MITKAFDFPIHTADSAPAPASDALRQVARAYGFVPNLMGVMAGAPALAEAYLAVAAAFDRTTLTQAERQVVLLAASFENDCSYCMAAHTTAAHVHQIDGAVVKSLREGTPLPDNKFEALRRFTAEVVESRGWPTPETVDQFLAAGYTSAQALEVVLGVGLKTLSNYTNHLADTPLDRAFSSLAWSAPACDRACAGS